MEVIGLEDAHPIDTRVAEPPALGQPVHAAQGLVRHERGAADPAPREIEDAGGDGVLDVAAALFGNVCIWVGSGG